MDNLLVTGNVTASDVEWLSSLDFRTTVERKDLDTAALIEALRGQRAYILGGVERVTREVLERSERLLVIAFPGVEYQSFIDVEAATEHGIGVVTAPGANARAVAEFTIALVLDGVRRLTHLASAATQGRWIEFRSWNLEGRTLGIVGMGRIGSIVARIARLGLDMRIVYHSRTRRADLEEELHATLLPLRDLLQTADVVSLHLPLSRGLEGLIGERELRLMKPHAVLTTTSRPELVDAHALRSALEEGRIGYAAMDGYYVEPVPSVERDPFGLLQFCPERLLVSPPTGYLTDDSMRRMRQMNATSIRRILDGGADQYVVNPDFAARACRRTPSD